MRVLALDVGQKSCGIAWSDSRQIVAHGKETFYFKPRDWASLIAHLKQTYLLETQLIVVGLPLLPSGSKSQTTHMIEEFCALLAQTTTLPIQFVEESYTTKTARELLIVAGLPRHKRQRQLDKVAAVLILQKYLDSKP